MTARREDVPQGPEAERRWRRLDRSTRRRIIGGKKPGSRHDALTTIGYAHQMHEKSRLWALLAAVGAFVVVLVLDLIFRGGFAPGSFSLAVAIGFGVALGIEVSTRSQARRLEGRAREALSDGER